MIGPEPNSQEIFVTHKNSFALLTYSPLDMHSIQAKKFLKKLDDEEKAVFEEIIATYQQKNKQESK